MRYVICTAAVLASLVAPATTSPAVMPLIDDGGSSGGTCVWNPFWRIECEIQSCVWVGRWEWVYNGQQCA